MLPPVVRRAALAACLALPAGLSAQAPALGPLADRVFARWRATTGPGCAVGIDRAGQPRFVRAYGAADLELDVPSTPATLYESGSIAKQFTAATVVLLALDGKLRLDDDVRRYVPELPQYERPITIRHLLNHTSGLRDWGDVAGLAGWPRGTRAHTHADVLDILSRQRALNYPPGDRYSYTNSGYNLLAIIAERVSGTPFGQLSRERLLAPLGLTHTQWRDGYTRVVKGRAQAYAPDGSGWRLDMPFEDVQGNGGLLFTVGDLLTWTAVLEQPAPRWKAMVDSLHVQARLTSDSTIPYALGLVVDEYRGLKRVQHSGATAGYRTMVLRFPGRGLSVAVLCNAANASAGQYADQIVDALLAPALAPRPTAVARATPRAADSTGWTPDAAAQQAYVGEYASRDVGVTWRVVADSGRLFVVMAPGHRVAMRPLARDRFDAPGTRVWFTRDAAGAVTALHGGTSRAYDVLFERRPPSAATR